MKASPEVIPSVHDTGYVGFVGRCNHVRKRIPFAYWLAFDAILAPLLVWGFVALSPFYAVGLAFLAVSLFFDVNEAIVKWAMRRG